VSENRRPNPYQGLPDHQFWRRSVGNVDRHAFDPVVATKFRIGAGERVATAGSCFAQHISRKLQSIDFNYLQCEDGAQLSEAERKARNYGTFSARFGNLYTARQLLQLFKRAYGRFDSGEPAWQRSDGHWADPFRPNVEPAGFASIEALQADRVVHLAAVRSMFEQADVFVFTMGLTEAWRSREDGAVFPIAPGVVAGDYDPSRYEFVNFSMHETEQDMAEFLVLLKSVNHGVKVLLTVSPVPLVATYEPRHVLVSTTYSKAVLRVAAESLCRRFAWLDYFPSFEIIIGSYNDGAYFEADHREVTSTGVAHAMRCFLANYLEHGPDAAGDIGTPILPSSPDPGGEIICDEEALDQVRI
jgi:hypothetical protein